MALVNPAALYGGGAFIVDTKPAMDFFLRQQAKQQAKEDALNKYFSTLTDKATDKGMRPQEAEAFQQAVKNYQDFYIQNSKELASGKNMALQMKAQQLAKLPFQIASDSRMANENEKALKTIWQTNPGLAERLDKQSTGIEIGDDGKVIELTDEQGNPIGLNAASKKIWINDNGNVVKGNQYKQIMPEDVIYNPTVLSTSEIDKRAEERIKPLEPKAIEINLGQDPNDKLKDRYQKVIKPKIEDLKLMGDALGDLFKDRQLSYSFEKINPKKIEDLNQEEFSKANEVFNSVYGRNIGNLKDYFVGIKLAEKAKPKVIEEGSRVNVKRTKEATISGQKSLIKYKEGLKGTGAKLTDIDVALDEFGNGKIPNTKYNIKDGYIYDENNNPVTAENITIPKSQIPVKLLEQVKKVGNPLFVDDIKVNIKNGVIESAAHPEFGTFKRSTFVSPALQSKGVKAKTLTEAPKLKEQEKPTNIKTIVGKSGKKITVPQ